MAVSVWAKRKPAACDTLPLGNALQAAGCSSGSVIETVYLSVTAFAAGVMIAPMG